MAAVGVGSAEAAPSPPFAECPAIGEDTSCAALIVVNADGSTTSYLDSGQGPVDGSDDVLVGVLNDSPSTVTTLPLSGPGIFSFDGDGLCTQPGAPSGCPFGPTSYEGPNTSFSITDDNDGSVSFPQGLAPGASTYFSLEGAANNVAPPPPGRVLGGLSLDTYCRSLGYVKSELSNPQHGPQAAYNNWVCVAADGASVPIDMQKACESTYSARPILARPTDPDDAYTWNCYQLSPPTVTITGTRAGNGKVQLTWTPGSNTTGAPITGYLVSVQPAGNDRVPAPSVPTPPQQPLPASTTTATFTGLVEDCHQLYKATVTPETGLGPGAPAVSAKFRPSGRVEPGAPPYVVILLDGIGESKAGFRMNPYDPTNPGEIPSYCPENVSSAGKAVPNDFSHEPHGPWEFFRKWNYFDPADVANGNQPVTDSNSTPRWIGPSRTIDGVRVHQRSTATHAFMLDAIAGHGAMIFPFSYEGATLDRHRNSSLQFVFNAYTRCNSSPSLLGGIGCDQDPGGSPDPTDDALHSISIGDDEHTLAREVASVRAIWPHVRVIVMGHSQGGLIAFDAWRHGLLRDVAHLFSLDSPINGVCPVRVPTSTNGFVCAGPADTGYPAYDDRFSRDPGLFAKDRAEGEPFRFIGTNGDKVSISFFSIHQPSYGTGNETLQHQLLVRHGGCVSAKDDAGCPEDLKHPRRWPDHISNCKIPDRGWENDDQHFIVKFCPGNVTYFNQTLRLTY
jgi:Fibronectin type III domain